MRIEAPWHSAVDGVGPLLDQGEKVLDACFARDTAGVLTCGLSRYAGPNQYGLFPGGAEAGWVSLVETLLPDPPRTAFPETALVILTDSRLVMASYEEEIGFSLWAQLPHAAFAGTSLLPGSRVRLSDGSIWVQGQEAYYELDFVTDRIVRYRHASEGSGEELVFGGSWVDLPAATAPQVGPVPYAGPKLPSAMDSLTFYADGDWRSYVALAFGDEVHLFSRDPLSQVVSQRRHSWARGNVLADPSDANADEILVRGVRILYPMTFQAVATASTDPADGALISPAVAQGSFIRATCRRYEGVASAASIDLRDGVSWVSTTHEVLRADSAGNFVTWAASVGAPSPGSPRFTSIDRNAGLQELRFVEGFPALLMDADPRTGMESELVLMSRDFEHVLFRRFYRDRVSVLGYGTGSLSSAPEGGRIILSRSISPPVGSSPFPVTP